MSRLLLALLVGSVTSRQFTVQNVDCGNNQNGTSSVEGWLCGVSFPMPSVAVSVHEPLVGDVKVNVTNMLNNERSSPSSSTP